MEERVQTLKDFFKKDRDNFLSSFTENVKAVSEEINEIEQKKTVKKTSVPRTPIQLNKINKYKFDLDKNNLKKKQKDVPCSGTIEESDLI